jgi:hypothetical protein
MSGAETVDLENRDPNGLNAHLGVSVYIHMAFRSMNFLLKMHVVLGFLKIGE